MATKFIFLALAVLIGLGGCDAVKSSRTDGLPLAEIKVDGTKPILASNGSDARYAVDSIDIIVPDSLRVSEENLFYPSADVVWRGEPQGDRLAQIKLILQEGLGAGVSTLKQGTAVNLSIQVERFHALTEKARFSVGGVHDVVFLLTVTDAKTAIVLEGPRRVEVSIRASGNDAAIAEDAAGRTQRVVIIEGLTKAIRDALSGPLAKAEPQRRGLFAGFR